VLYQFSSNCSLNTHSWVNFSYREKRKSSKEIDNQKKKLFLKELLFSQLEISISLLNLQNEPFQYSQFQLSKAVLLGISLSSHKGG